MKLGIIILNYNTYSDTVACVKSIEETTSCDYLIYIIDGCSADDSAGKLKNMYKSNKRIKVIQSDINGGFSYGNNIGIREACLDNCTYLLISNPDVEYYDNAIDSMLFNIENNSDIGVIGPSTKSLDQDESQLFRKPYTKEIYNFSKKPLRYIRRYFPWLQSEYCSIIKDETNIFKFRGMVRGCCFMFSTDLVKKMGLLDDHVFLYSEEWILAKKLDSQGLKCACDFNSRILHKEATSTEQRGSSFQTFHLYLSAYYYLKEYLEIGKIGLLYYLIANIFSYSIHSMCSSEYRQKLIPFAKANWKLMKYNNIYLREFNENI